MSELMNEIKRAAVGDGKYAGLPSHVYSLFGDALAKLDEVAALEARLSKMEEAAIEAEKMFDVMAIEGIKDWLVPPMRQLYAEVHTDLREALKRDEGVIPW